ncbi:hypothetical protein DFH09DRAFT_1317892 [Mycena vulgaris]|nr:hypothetical protein DFH09DRAFT_1317892 [Mycena vulgaris]
MSGHQWWGQRRLHLRYSMNFMLLGGDITEKYPPHRILHDMELLDVDRCGDDPDCEMAPLPVSNERTGLSLYYSEQSDSEQAESDSEAARATSDPGCTPEHLPPCVAAWEVQDDGAITINPLLYRVVSIRRNRKTEGIDTVFGRTINAMEHVVASKPRTLFHKHARHIRFLDIHSTAAGRPNPDATIDFHIPIFIGDPTALLGLLAGLQLHRQSARTSRYTPGTSQGILDRLSPSC